MTTPEKELHTWASEAVRRLIRRAVRRAAVALAAGKLLGVWE
tara:strand:- start:626 stop:751 length:126 start_codon:yes stop_codon:yes gene_type:complete